MRIPLAKKWGKPSDIYDPKLRVWSEEYNDIQDAIYEKEPPKGGKSRRKKKRTKKSKKSKKSKRKRSRKARK